MCVDGMSISWASTCRLQKSRQALRFPWDGSQLVEDYFATSRTSCCHLLAQQEQVGCFSENCPVQMAPWLLSTLLLVSADQLLAAPIRAELHVHLDGSMDFATLLAICKKRGVELPGIGIPKSAQDIQAFMGTFSGWHRFDAVNNIIGGSVSSIQAAAESFVKFQAESGVFYTEVRYDPVRLARSDLDNSSITEEQAVKAVQDGLAAGSVRHGVVVYQLLCAMRGASSQRCFQTAELAAKLADNAMGGVVGLDLAGDEADFPNRAYIDCFKHAKSLGLNTTVHAGEFNKTMGDDVRTAIFEMAADRIGHGYAAAFDEQILQALKLRKVHVEACPKSALLHGAWALNAIRSFRQHGLNFGLNTDDPASSFSNTSAAQDESIVTGKLDFSPEDVRSAYINAYDARFGDLRESVFVYA
eukprot:s615_g18.t1